MATYIGPFVPQIGCHIAWALQALTERDVASTSHAHKSTLGALQSGVTKIYPAMDDRLSVPLLGAVDYTFSTSAVQLHIRALGRHALELNSGFWIILIAAALRLANGGWAAAAWCGCPIGLLIILCEVHQLLHLQTMKSY